MYNMPCMYYLTAYNHCSSPGILLWLACAVAKLVVSAIVGIENIEFVAIVANVVNVKSASSCACTKQNMHVEHTRRQHK